MHHPQRVTKLFAFAANSDPSAVKDIGKSPVFTAFIARAEREYANTEFPAARRTSSTSYVTRGDARSGPRAPPPV